MDGARFDAMTRALSRRTARRTAVLGGFAATIAGLGGRLAAQDAATPGASPLAAPGATPGATPAASPVPLDRLAGTPPAESAALGRIAGGYCGPNRFCCEGTCFTYSKYYIGPCNNDTNCAERNCRCGECAVSAEGQGTCNSQSGCGVNAFNCEGTCFTYSKYYIGPCNNDTNCAERKCRCGMCAA